MASKKPLVSVVLLTYNQEEFVEDAILSAVNQDYENLEVIVADDFSTDRTREIIKELEIKYPNRVVPLLNEKNLGITKNTNNALAKCRGEYVSFLGGDDVYLQHKIAAQVEFLSNHPEFCIAAHDVDVFNSDTNESYYLWSERYGAGRGDVKRLVRFGPSIAALSVMVRRKDIPNYGSDERIKHASDWLMWIAILANSGKKIGYINEVLGRYRRHSDNITLKWNTKIEDQLMSLGIIERTWPFLLIAVRKRRSELFIMMAIRQIANRNYNNAFWYICQSFLMGFPTIFPAARLVFRELKFILSGMGKSDDLLRTLFEKSRT